VAFMSVGATGISWSEVLWQLIFTKQKFLC